jgi:acyl-CoA synthetase (AMP-forming)/AMP-acid ligase II
VLVRKLTTSLGQLVRDSATRFGERPVFRCKGQVTSFATLEQRTNQLAQVLAGLGIKHTERVAVMLPNDTRFPTVWLALAKLGAVIVPLNTQYQTDDLRFVLRDAEAKLVIAAPDYLALLERVQADCPSLEQIAVFTERSGIAMTSQLDEPWQLDKNSIDIEARMASSSTEFVLPVIQADDLLNLQYTSGTTGFPKGCMLTHGYWLELVQRASEIYNVRPDDVTLTAQPFYYMDPQWNTALCVLTGIPLVIEPKFSASKFWHSIKEHGVTFFYCLGTMPILLLKQPENPELEREHRVRIVYCSGIYPPLHATLEQRFGSPWREAFGMTETGLDLAVPIQATQTVGTGTMGQPVSGKEACIMNEAGQELKEGERGELCVRGGTIMQGYWHNPEATAKTLRDGWLHTGDLAYCQNGQYFLVGRLKDMIRRGSENIAAAEVEAVACGHEYVLAVAVVAQPDDIRGEEVRLFVQLKPDMQLDPLELLEFMRLKIAAFKVPRFITLVEDMPRTPSERIAKHKLFETPQRTFDATTQAWSDL